MLNKDFVFYFIFFRILACCIVFWELKKNIRMTLIFNERAGFVYR